MQDNIFPFPTETTLCRLCGGNTARVVFETESFPYGVGEEEVLLTAKVPVIHCDACGGQVTDEAAEEIRHSVVCNHLGRLSPHEVRSIRERYGLSQQEWAKKSKLGIASVKRWESGNQIQNEAMDAYMRLLAIPSNFEKISSKRLPLQTERDFSFRTNLPRPSIEASMVFSLRKVN
jgi:putative zinc finger/helix-turn-helix YgiT family protein